MLKTERKDVMYVVGIGSSAGGLHALELFFKNLRSSIHTAYIVAQHLDPKSDSILTGIVQKYTDIPVLTASDEMLIEPDHIYICPKGKNITVEVDKIRLSKPVNRNKPAIDRLFLSLATTYGTRSIGVVLSGSGSDGTKGIEAINSAGGITLAEDESSAQFFSMPSSAISSGYIDIVLSPDMMARSLPAIINDPESYGHTKYYEKYKSIFALLLKKLSVDLFNYKLSTIRRRINRRIVATKSHTIDEYIVLLQDSDDELQTLRDELLIVVSSFFRDRDAFDGLEKHLTGSLEHKAENEPLRIWIAGCGNGEEVYSIAILALEVMAKSGLERKLQIFATDIHPAALERAREGLYSEKEMKGVESSIRAKYFHEEDGHHRIDRTIRTMIVFARHDLINDPVFLHIDLLSCRNLLIYFNLQLQKRAFGLFHRALDDDGSLFLGKSENTIHLTDLFIPVNSRWRIFKKDLSVDPGYVNNMIYAHQKRALSTFIPKLENMTMDTKSMTQEVSIVHELNASIFGAFSDTLIVVDRNDELIYSHGSIEKYIAIPKGVYSPKVFSMIADESLRVDMKIVLAKARKEKRMLYQRFLLKSDEKRVRYLDIVALPVVSDLAADRVAVVFLDTAEVYIEESAEVGSSRHYFELEHELIITKEHLTTAVGELETSNEEVQASNEELQSANEELQTTNEELETSNEELQNSNEELVHLIDALNIKTDELHLSNEELQQHKEHLEEMVGSRTEQLQKGQDNLQTILDSAESIILVSHEGERLISANDAFFDFFGYSTLEGFNAEHHCVCEIFEVVEEEGYIYLDDEVHEKNWVHLVVTSAHQNFKVKITKDGKSHIFTLRISLLDPEIEDSIEYVIVMNDITDIIEHEHSHRKSLKKEMALKDALIEKEEIMRAQSRLATMGEMLSMIAHQWRQPLSTISMMANNLLADVELEILETETVHSTAKDLLMQTQYLSSTIEDFRDFFRSDKGKEEVLLQKLIDDSLLIIGGSLRNNAITFKLVGTTGIVLNTYGRELMQVIVNIIKNAKEALVEMHVDEPKIVLSVQMDSAEIVIDICNNGPLIEKQVVNHIFEPYFTTKDVHNGTGIGLYMSKSIIETHLKGRLTYVEKEGGVKVCFRMELPIIESKV